MSQMTTIVASSPRSNTAPLTSCVTEPSSPTKTKPHPLNVSVERALAADAEAIARVGRAGFGFTFLPAVGPVRLAWYLDRTYTPSAIAYDLTLPGKVTLVARSNSSSHGSTSSDHNSSGHNSSSASSSASASASSPSFFSTAESVVVGIIQFHPSQPLPPGCPLPWNLDNNSSSSAPKFGVLQRCYVDPTYYGRGVGGQLVAAVEDMARKEGIAVLWLLVSKSNPRGVRYWKNKGYEIVGLKPIIIGEGDFAVEYVDHVMAKKLWTE